MIKLKDYRYLGVAALSGLLMLTAITGAWSDDATLLPNAIQYFMDANGKPLANGKVFMYTPNTTTPKTTWTTADKATAQPQPFIPLGITGKPASPIYGDGSYRQKVVDQFNNTIWDFNTASTGGGGSTPTPPVSVGDGNTVGTILAWPGLLAPSNYVFAYGQAISRTTYATLFNTTTLVTNVICTSGLSVISGLADTQNIRVGSPIEVSCLPPGTTVTSVASTSVAVSANATISTAVSATFFPFGNGDGSTTFNLPDLRGRTLFGRNNMGGVASTNLTTFEYGASPNGLGTAGPAGNRVINTPNTPPYTPVGTITNGTITSTFTGTAGQQALGAGGGTEGFTSGALGHSVPSGTIVSSQATSTFTGTLGGGTSVPLSIVPPASTMNYIVKVLPDSVPSAVATSIIVGTTGVAGGTTNGILYDNGGVLGNIPTVNNGIMLSNGTGVPSFSTVLPALTFDSAVFRGATSGTVTLSADVVAGTQVVHVPESSGSIPAWVTPQYVGALCNGTDDTTLIQSAITNLPSTGGIIYFPPGSVCSTSSTIIIPASKPNITFLGVSIKNERAGASSMLVYTGTGARFIDARDSRGFRIEGMEVTYTSSSFTGRLVDVSTATPGSAVNAFSSIVNSRLATSTDRTGTATLVYAGGTVDLNIDSVYFLHGAPAFSGQAILGQNVRTTITNSTFASSDTIPINGCGETMVVRGNSFEPLTSGVAGAFTGTTPLYCKGGTWDSNWYGDGTVDGGTWIEGSFQGTSFVNQQMAGPVAAATTQGIKLNSSTGVTITGRFELLLNAVNCVSSNVGVTVHATTTSVTNLVANPSGCTGLNTDDSSPPASQLTANALLLGSTSGPASLGALGTTTTLLHGNAAGAPTFGAVANADLVNPATTVNGQTCTLGSTCTVVAAATSMAVGTTTVTSGTSTRVLYDNAGVLGEYTNAQLTAQINAATTSLSGAVPAWPGNTTSFFRGDGTYTAVAVSGLSGLGTSVATALATNIGSAGAPVLFNGAGGTPSSLTLTNATGLPTAGMIDAAVTYAKIQNVAGLSLFGRSASSAGVGAAITPGDIKQVMRVDATGTTIGWGSIDLAYVGVVGTSILGAANGGTGLSALGTGVATAFGVNVGSAGAIVINGGALGTPSSGSASNLTGTTASVDTSNTNLATNAYVLNQAAAATPLGDGTAAVGTSTRYARADHVHPIYSQMGVISATATGVNFNSANTDNALTIALPPGYTRFMPWRINFSNASGTIGTATYGLFSAAAGAGVAIQSAGSATSITSTADATNGNASTNNTTLGNITFVSASLATPNTVFLRVGTAQGTAVTADVEFLYFPIK